MGDVSQERRNLLALLVSVARGAEVRERLDGGDKRVVLVEVSAGALLVVPMREGAVPKLPRHPLAGRRHGRRLRVARVRVTVLLRSVPVPLPAVVVFLLRILTASTHGAGAGGGAATAAGQEYP